MGNSVCEFELVPTQWQQENNRLCVLDDTDGELLDDVGGTMVWSCERIEIVEDNHCIFHIPDGKEERKNEELIDSINEGDPNQHYIGSKFGDLEISNLNISSQSPSYLDLRYNTISGDLDIVSTETDSNIDFTGAKILGDISLFNSNIDADVILENTIINGNVFISGSSVTGSVDFTGANLNGYVRVTNSHINGIIDFSDTGLVNVAIESSEVGAILADTIADLTQRIPDSFL